MRVFLLDLYWKHQPYFHCTILLFHFCRNVDFYQAWRWVSFMSQYFYLNHIRHFFKWLYEWKEKTVFLSGGRTSVVKSMASALGLPHRSVCMQKDAKKFSLQPVWTNNMPDYKAILFLFRTRHQLIKFSGNWKKKGFSHWHNSHKNRKTVKYSHTSAQMSQPSLQHTASNDESFQTFLTTDNNMWTASLVGTCCGFGGFILIPVKY